MLDFIGDVLTTIFSTFIIGLCGITIVDPLRSRLIIYKKILRVIRNFEDPRKLGDGFVPNTILIDNIKKQTEAIEAILDLVEEQKDLRRFWYWLFNYKEVSRYLNILFEYIGNPIMLKGQKEFEDDYVLNTNMFFKKLKKKAKIPNGKIISIIFFRAL